MCIASTIIALASAAASTAGAVVTAKSKPKPPPVAAQAIDNSLVDDAAEVDLGKKNKAQRKTPTGKKTIKKTASTGIKIL